jgi:hypothetical protein
MDGGIETAMFSIGFHHRLGEAGVRTDGPCRTHEASARQQEERQIDALIIADLLRCNMFATCSAMVPELAALPLEART